MPVLKAERPLFKIVQAVLVLLLKGHSAGVTVEKSMRMDFFFFFFFFFCDLIPDFFLFSPLFLSLCFLSLLVSFLSPSSLVALVWLERGCDSKITG